MIIDAHHHLWDPTRREYPWMAGEALSPIRKPYGLAELRAVTEPAGVTGTVLVQTVASVSETAEFLAVTGDLVLGVVGWANLTAPDIADRLAELREMPGGDRLVGIRHLVEAEADPDWLTRPDVRRGLAALADAGLIYDLLVNPAQYPSVLRAVDALPGGSFVLDHAGKPGVPSPDWTKWIHELAERSTVVCKLSGLVTEVSWTDWQVADLAPVAARVLDAFGPDRVLFGSDWPVCELAASYGEVLSAARALTTGLSSSERDAVFGDNARRVYGLP